ncbi:hypothetical protein [uncultured Thiothrix sp.]|uniref:hypothetical protein n=1 Tax=uncultured Thiothrix sp. TaxID=223185 RepID=UPI002637999D|nr:hypothetical protein [uncultured Thiothrix sp.]
MNELVQYQHGARFHAKAVHYSRYYTLEQLKQFYSTASLGFICASFASWALMAFFIGQFFAGAEFESMHEWRAIQFVYAAMGIALATAITIAEAVLFNSGRAREYLLVMGFSVGFSIFAESAATMQREQSTVAFKSTQSEVYKATIKSIDVLSTTSTLTPAQIKLAQLQASYAEAKQLGNKGAMDALQARILRLEQQAELEQANRTTSLQNTITQAKALEYDETKHQAMIRFLSEVFGLSSVVASALLAFFLILTFKICFHYLGAMRQLNERAISINTGKISASIEQFRIAPSSGSQSENSLQLPVIQLPVENEELANNSSISTVYTKAESAKVGALISCPNCGGQFQKSNKWHLFCSNNRKPRADGGNCSDDWHNAQKPERAAHVESRKT